MLIFVGGGAPTETEETEMAYGAQQPKQCPHCDATPFGQAALTRHLRTHEAPAFEEPAQG